MNNPIFAYQKYARRQIEHTEKLIKIYPKNTLLPVIREWWLRDLLYTQLKYFNRNKNDKHQF